MGLSAEALWSGLMGSRGHWDLRSVVLSLRLRHLVPASAAVVVETDVNQHVVWQKHRAPLKVSVWALASKVPVVMKEVRLTMAAMVV